MSMNLAYHYYFVQKVDGLCCQYNNSNNPNFSLNNDSVFSIQMDGEYNIFGAYLHRPDMTPAQSADDVAGWFRKVWNELDENGVPVEESGFIWEAFTPKLVEG